MEISRNDYQELQLDKKKQPSLTLAQTLILSTNERKFDHFACRGPFY